MSTSIYDGFFKKTPEGYLFRAPTPWLFGAGKHYLANDAQRAEILELGRVRHPVVYALVFALVIIACPAGSTLLVYLLSGHAEPAGADIAAIAILTSLSLLTSLLIVARLRLRRLRPILMRLPRSQKSLTLRDIQTMQLQAISLKKLLILGAVLAASAVVQAISLAFIIGMDVGARICLSDRARSSRSVLCCFRAGLLRFTSNGRLRAYTTPLAAPHDQPRAAPKILQGNGWFVRQSAGSRRRTVGRRRSGRSRPFLAKPPGASAFGRASDIARHRRSA